MKESRYWQTKLIYLKSVTGEEIVSKYNELTSSETTDVAATQIFQRDNSPPDTPYYDAFIYYKEKFAGVKGL